MPEVKVTCAKCPYLIDSEFGYYCMATSCPEEDEEIIQNALNKKEQKDILVFKINTYVDEETTDRIIETWTKKLNEMRETGIIVLPRFLDFIGPVCDSDIEIYNSKGEEVWEQKKR